MKSPMSLKETIDKKYHEDPFRAVNFKTSAGSDCPYAEHCKKPPHNRRISLNRELIKVHADVMERLTDTRGFLLRRNRAIQAEGTLGVMKNARAYDRVIR